LPGLAASAPAQTAPAQLEAHPNSGQFEQPGALVGEIPTGDIPTGADQNKVRPAPVEPAFAAVAPSAEQLASIECLAKVVHREAGNQSEKGQLAVAQLVMNRLRAGGRFGDSVCSVVNQRGQFFNTNSYHPDRTSGQWASAVKVSRDAIAHASPEVMPGALFYHAVYQAPPRFFRTRQRLAVLGDHIFYR
jgi:spore germination cell wall hydrolase CwlJ-like protein